MLQYDDKAISLIIDSDTYVFDNAQLAFENEKVRDVFMHYRKKTLNETLENKKYCELNQIVRSKYKKYLDCKLGDFMKTLKEANDGFYKCFLNPYGDKTYTTFKILDDKYRNEKGVYAYCLNKNLMYIGRCNDSFYKRINQGYGKIAPKNCYKDGQSTNCHINSLIAEAGNNVRLYIMCLNNSINELEEKLIKKYNPEWNVQLKI